MVDLKIIKNIFWKYIEKMQILCYNNYNRCNKFVKKKAYILRKLIINL